MQTADEATPVAIGNLEKRSFSVVVRSVDMEKETVNIPKF